MDKSSIRATLGTVLGLLWACGPAQATPYASALTNSGTAISFRLNEAADSVRIIYNGGGTTNDLGPRAAGLHTIALAITGAFEVEVNKGPNLGYLQGVANQISADTNRWVRFNAPRGVAVNRNPASPYFGRIYVANADTGSVAAVSRVLVNGDGIFMLNADFTDAVGQGDVARTAGLNFRDPPVTDNANKPFRIEVGEDNNLYISDYSTATNPIPTGNLYVTDPDVSPGSGVNVFTFDPDIAGRIPSSAIVKGSLAAGNLTVYAVYPDKNYEYDFFGSPATSFSVMQRWNVGAGPLPAAAAPVRVTDLPILVADVPSVLSDIDLAPDGKYFIAQNRSAGLEGGLFVVDPAKDQDGSGYPDIVFNSYAYSLAFFGATNDLLFQTRAVKVAPDGSVVALVRDDNRIWIIPLTNGIPDLNARILMENPPTTTLGRDLSFDAAGNLYTASSGQSAVRAFSPGYPSRAVTSSAGTFSLTRTTNALPLVNITATDTNLYEGLMADVASVIIARAGDISGPLDIGLVFSGSAEEGRDFAAATLVTIPAGSVRATNMFVPLNNSLLDGTRAIIVSLDPSGAYDIGTPASVTLQIRDDEVAPTSPVVFSDDFDADTAANYTVHFGAENNVDDKVVLFNHDYSLDGVPSAPNSVGGTTRGLKLTVNKNDASGSAAGVNVYPVGLNVGGDFVLRFDMFLTFNSAVAGTTEHAIFGVNHGGDRTNRALTGGGKVGGDGLWCAVETDGSASSSGRSYAIFATTDPAVAPAFTSASARSFDTFFTSPPFIGIPAGAPSGRWVNVELWHTNRTATLRINAVTILSRTNNTPYTSGTIMLGHMDSFNSIGSTGNYTIFDNVRVIDLNKPRLTLIRREGATLEIYFTGSAGDSADAFTLESAGTITSAFGPDAGASITQLEPGRFRAVSLNSGDPQRFYRVRRN